MSSYYFNYDLLPFFSKLIFKYLTFLSSHQVHSQNALSCLNHKGVTFLLAEIFRMVV